MPSLAALQDLVHVGFASMSPQGLLPMLVEAVPSVENGQWKVFADGQMETTWTLRPNARWHDGVAVSAADLVFTVQVASDADLPEFKNGFTSLLAGVEARDARTVVARWKRPFISADWLFAAGMGEITGSFMPLPKHLLEGPYTENKTTLMGLPYWKQEFVGTGPFKVKDFVQSSHVLVAANDQYVLGRPKIDEIEVKFIADSNAIVVEMLSGAVDMTLGRAIALEQALSVQNGGAARAEATPFNLQRMYAQFINPRPAVLGDARLRQALLFAINRQEMIDNLEGGLTVVPVSILPNDSQYPEVEANVSRYPHDPLRAVQLLQDLGYVRGADGAYATASGGKLGAIELRGITQDDHQLKLLFAIADYWQRLGIPADPVLISPQQNQDRADKANRPGFALTGGPNSLGALPTMVSQQIPRAENNYVGNNSSGYSSPEYDALYQRYSTTIPRDERMRVLAQILEVFTRDLPFLPLYYRVEARVVGNRLSNLSPRTLDASPGWDVHLWEVR